jgi:hypothetical protein
MIEEDDATTCTNQKLRIYTRAAGMLLARDHRPLTVSPSSESRSCTSLKNLSWFLIVDSISATSLYGSPPVLLRLQIEIARTYPFRGALLVLDAARQLKMVFTLGFCPVTPY